MRPQGLYFEGESGRPLVLFIHGMGMDENIWSNPAEARVLGGLYPLGVVFKDVSDGMTTSFSDMRERGYPVLAWSQSRPAGPMETAVEELTSLVEQYSVHAAEGIILIGHSRGGLVARKFLEGWDAGIRGIITLASPHRGSSLARLAGYVAPAAALMERVLEHYTKRELSVAIQRVCRFLGSSGLKELLPGSPFLGALSPLKHSGVSYFSAGGTDPDMFKIRSFYLSEFAARIVPEKCLPDELRRGLGDGMVAAASAVMPQAEEHRDFAVHHVSILFAPQVRDYVADKVGNM